MELADKAAFQIKALEEGGSGHISIAALTTSSEALSQCLIAFSNKYPEITVDITFTSGRSQVVEMSEAKYDFHFAVEEMVPMGEAFSYIRTHKDRLCMAFPKKHPMAGKPLDFAALKGERFITVTESDGPALYGSIMRVCKARGYTPRVTCQYDRAEAVLLSVGAGLGRAIIPEALSKVFYSQNVSFTPIEGEDAQRQYVLAWHTEMSNPAARLFLETAKACIAGRRLSTLINFKKERKLKYGNKFKPDSQSIVSYSLMGPESGGPCLVDTNGGRITRIRPYYYDKEYTDPTAIPGK